jgi:predicted O-methyltransferase YrrM
VEKFLAGKISKDDKRYPTFLHSLRLLTERKARVLVETGTARKGSEGFSSDGGSTFLFAHWAMDHDGKLYSIDNDPRAIEKARSSVQALDPYIEFICSDSLLFLQNSLEPIDFLYLDSYDFDVQDPFPSQMHHLKEIKAAYSKLHEKSIVMIDDCDLYLGGKGLLVIDFLLENGWRIELFAYQAILVKETARP